MNYLLEQDGYRYYMHPLTQRVFSLDSAGYWYVQGADQTFVHIEEDSIELEKKAENASAKIDWGDDGYPIFPRNDKGQTILPKNYLGEPTYPLDAHGNPIFPFDRDKKTWTFPLDEKDEPIFPFNAAGKPLVPQDEKGNVFLKR